MLALVAGAGLVAGRGLLLDERAHGSADAVALAAASVLELRYGGDIDGGGARASVHATESAARAAAGASRNGSARRWSRSSSSVDRATRRRSRCACRASARRRGAGRVRARRASASRSPPPAVGFRIADVRGLDAAGAVVAAALAQLGWPYVWGGESRAEGGFDCSGLVDYALAAAGRPVGRLDAAGLQRLAQPLAAGAGLLPGDLVFVGLPAHHVGLVVAPGLAVEAPHRGAQVRVEPLGDGGWTGAGRILPPAAGGAKRRRRPRRARLRARAAAYAGGARGARRATAPGAARGATRGRERIRPRAVSPAGAQGIAQFMPATWGAGWNPQRERSPFEPGPAIAAQARLMHDLLERSAGDVASALAAYNAGPMVLERAWPRETRAYVARVMRRFGGPVAFAAEVPSSIAGAGAAQPGRSPEVRLLP